MRLKILLQSNVLYIILFIFLILFVYYKTIYKSYDSLYEGNEIEITGYITDYKITDTKLSLTVLADEKIIINYYFAENDEIDLSNLYGKKVTAYGEIYEASGSSIPNTFNYKKYLYNNEIYYLFSADYLSLETGDFNLKNNLVNRVSNLKSGSYLMLFILGDKSYLSSDVYTAYQENGIAHLLAISGLHISLFIVLLEKIFKDIKKNARNYIIFTFLFFYSYITSFPVSVLRCIIFQILKVFTDRFNVQISKVYMLFLTAFILLIYNPFYIYNTGFLYSFVITFFLLNLKPLEKNNYFKSSLQISFISFLASLPITASMNYEINISSVFFNLFFVPFVSFIVFPLSLLTFIFPLLDSVLYFFTNIMELTNNFCSCYLSIIINIPFMSYFTLFIYYINLYLFIKLKKRYLIFLCFILFFNKISYKISSNYNVYYMDVGQGDCQVLISPHQSEVIMIDTGGNYYYSVSDNVILFLKSIGITTIDLLVLSHGDSDHALDTENIYNNLNIKNIMFNENELNDLELEILSLEINRVYEVDLKYFNAQNINENVDNENDASIVLFFQMYQTKFLFTGDIGTEPLTTLVNTYNLEVDIYKVAHHGSKNNSSEYIYELVNPSIAVISAGENNIYNHPSDEVIEMLINLNIKYYQTLSDGTVQIEISKNSYNIFNYYS